MSYFKVGILTIAIITLMGCSRELVVAQPFTFDVDVELVPSQPLLPGLDHGQPREVGVMLTPSGSTVEYALGEVIFRPTDQADLDLFLTRYGGTVLRDGTVPVGEGITLTEQQKSSGWYLVQIDLTKSAVDDLPANLHKRKIGGHHSFSSKRAAATASVIAREFDRDLRPNFIFQGNAVNEHPDDSSGFLDAETWAWMNEDDEPTIPGDQGLSVGVIHAWEYLSYFDIPPTNGTFEPVVIAIIDTGFALDEAGYPTDGNTDYFPPRPLQFDLIDYDESVGGANQIPCAGTFCPWHGTGAFGVALARHGNLYGGAGTSGNVAWPMLIRVDFTAYTIADGIRAAAINGADVISLSLSGGCPIAAWICSIPPDDIYITLQNAVDLATTFGAVVVAAAGNDGIDVATTDVIPCTLARVICVGGINESKENVFNYGAAVDIWAPSFIFSTVTPASAARDANDIGVDELDRFDGTSASTPFVAGIVGLMKALDPDIRWDRVQSILQQTANPSNDSRVPVGYVDAYRAVQAVRDNQEPSIAIVRPIAGSDISYRPAGSFRAEASDPENDNPNSGVVVWTSSVDGELCTVNGFYFASLANQCNPVLSLGNHVFTANAVDAHGASMQDVVTVAVVNHPPTIQVTQFAPGTSFFSNQTIILSAYANDVDEGPPFNQGRLTWSSSLDGPLGLGTGLEVSLSVGMHTLTAVATDELGRIAEGATSVTILASDGVPSVQILEPTVGLVGPGTVVTFRATAIDPEDGVLSGASLEWISSIDGTIGVGTELQAVLSAPGISCNPSSVRHTITLKVTDSDGNVVLETAQVAVGTIC